MKSNYVNKQPRVKKILRSDGMLLIIREENDKIIVRPAIDNTQETTW